MAKRLYSPSRETLRSLLKDLRTTAGLTQTELSDKLGRPQSFVSDYERGHRRLDWVGVQEAVEACGGDLVDFARRYKKAAHKSPGTGD